MTTATLALLFLTATKTFGLPPNLLASLCYVESTHNVNAIHKDDGGSNSVGVCQVKLNTAKWLGFTGSEKELMRPDVNIFYAAKFLHWQIKRYNGSVEKAVIAYNVGNAKRLLHTVYANKVLAKWKDDKKWQLRSSALEIK